MRLEKITLRNFRAVADSTIEFGPGVTIVAGPNEVGKSSIAEALRMVRNVKHSSKAQAVKAVQPVGKDVGPEVELELTVAGNHVWVRKQWLRGEATELRVHGAVNENLSGDEAHERFNTLLEQHMDVELFNALEVLQGESLQTAQLVGLKSLSEALDESSSTVADHDALMSRIESEFSLHFTPTGRPKGDYRALGEEVDALSTALAEAEEESREMDHLTHEVEVTRGLVEEREGELEKAKENLAACQKADQALEELREGVQRAAEEVETATAHLEAVTQAQRTRQELIDDEVARTQALEKAREEFDSLATEVGDFEAELKAAKTAREEAQLEVKTARTKAKEAAEAVTAETNRQELQGLTTRFAEAEAAQQRRLEASETIANIAVDRPLLDELSQAHADHVAAKRARDAAAARVTITPAAGASVNVNDEPIEEPSEQVLSEALTVDSPGVVTVQVEPGALPEDVEREVSQTSDHFTELLERAQVEGLEEARAQVATREDAEKAREIAQHAFESALDGDSFDELREKLTILRSAVGEEEATTAQDLTALKEAATEASAGVSKAEEALEATAGAHEEKSERVKNSQIARARLETAVSGQEDELQRVKEQLVAAREETTDEQLTTAIPTAQTALEGATTRASAAEGELNEANPDAVRIELENATEWETTATTRVEEVVATLHGLNARLAERTAKGLYEQVQELRGQLGEVTLRYERTRRRAESARLLRDVMVRHRDEAHARYVAPFQKRITSLGRVVFGPDFAVDITPELQISHRTLDNRHIPFEQLSAGAREQLGLLGRLAAAALVEEQEGAPLILDDTLGFADDTRLAALGAVLNEVGRNTQIVVLTCQPSRFTRVGGAELVNLSASGIA